MSGQYEFSPVKIAEHTMKVGSDIRPVIEPKLDDQKLLTVGGRLRDKYPNLFESLVQSPTDFRINKRFIFPGSGQIELTTLTITPRGPVFVFPHIVGALEEEIDIPDVESTAVECLRIFTKVFAGKKVIRVGVVNEYVFDTGLQNSAELIAKRFTKVSVLGEGEIRLRVNNPTDDFNRVIDMQAVKRLEPVPEMESVQTAGYGVKVTVDINNRDMTNEIGNATVLEVLHEGKTFNNEGLYAFLNGVNGG